jgi:hypothetical protein
MKVTKTKGGDRAILVYLLDADGIDVAALETAVETALTDAGVDKVEMGAAIGDTVGYKRTVETVLTCGEWSRSIRVGACSGLFLSTLYFCEQPQPPAPPTPPETDDDTAVDDGTVDDDPEIIDDDGDGGDVEPEPEPLNITEVICEKLRETFTGAAFGASAFVIKQTQNEFDYLIEVAAL